MLTQYNMTDWLIDQLSCAFNQTYGQHHRQIMKVSKPFWLDMLTNLSNVISNARLNGQSQQLTYVYVVTTEVSVAQTRANKSFYVVS